MDSEEKTLPDGLLLKSKVDRFEYFKNKVFGHDQLLKVNDELLNTILYPTDVSLILVYGPTGVGKTTLRSRMEQKILEFEYEAMVRDPGYLPVVSMEAIASSRNYEWKEHMTRLLMAAKEPLIDHKINPEARKTTLGSESVNIYRTESILRRAAESCLQHRGTKVVIVDEAQHLRRTGSERNALHQMDTIKSLAETTGTIHVLIGTYELLELARLSAQLCKRSTYIHFSRYSNHTSEDQDAFASILQAFQNHFPLAQTPDLLPFEDYFYEKTFGCVGVLKIMLNGVLAKALQSKDEIVTEAMLETSAPPLQDLVQMSREIADGERFLRETDEQLVELRTFLNTVPMSTSKSKAKGDKGGVEAQTGTLGGRKQNGTRTESEESPASKPKRGRRPGERLPKRDPVGGRKNDS